MSYCSIRLDTKGVNLRTVPPPSYVLTWGVVDIFYPPHFSSPNLAFLCRNLDYKPYSVNQSKISRIFGCFNG